MKTKVSAESPPKTTVKRDWRSICCDVMVVAAGVSIVTGAFLLHAAAGCFALGGVLAVLASLLQQR